MSGASKRLKVDGKRLEGITRGPLPASRKVHVPGVLYPDVRVPLREISQTDTRHGHGPQASVTPNPPVQVYDASGPYTDPAAELDLRRGLPPLRAQWIERRGDTEALPGISSEYGRVREADARLAGLRLGHRRAPRVARAGANVTQLHYARRGLITPEMEFVALRENLQREAVAAELAQKVELPAGIARVEATGPFLNFFVDVGEFVRGVTRGNGEVGEDEGARGEKELDALTKRHVELIDEMAKNKEQELLEV